MAELRGSRTHENLRRALERDAVAQRRHVHFARLADLAGQPALAGLFRETAAAETGHALRHLELLSSAGDPLTGGPLRDTRDHLAAAAEAARQESTTVLPEMARAARSEGFPEIAAWFEELARAEAHHAERFAEALRRLG